MEVKPQKRSKFHPIIRIISSILILSFLLYDITWAYPDLSLQHKQQDSTLAPSSFFAKKGSPEEVYGRVIEEYIERNNVPRDKLVLGTVLGILERYKGEEWFAGNIKYYPEYKGSDIAEIRISFSAKYLFRYFDPRFADEDRYANQLEKISYTDPVTFEKRLLDTLPLNEGKLSKQVLKVEALAGPAEETAGAVSGRPAFDRQENALLWYEIALSGLAGFTIALLSGYGAINSILSASLAVMLGISFHESRHYTKARELLSGHARRLGMTAYAKDYGRSFFSAIFGRDDGAILKVSIDTKGVHLDHPAKLFTAEENIAIAKSGAFGNMILVGFSFLASYSSYGLFDSFKPFIVTVAAVSLAQALLSFLREGGLFRDEAPDGTGDPDRTIDGEPEAGTAPDMWRNNDPSGEDDALKEKVISAMRHIGDDRVTKKTPLLRMRRLSDMAGKPVFLKDESVQVSGSFKMRGVAFEVDEAVRGRIAEIDKLDPSLRDRPFYIVTQTDGNHGIAMIEAVRLAVEKYCRLRPDLKQFLRGIEPVVFTIRGLPEVKRGAMVRYLDDYRRSAGSASKGEIREYKDYAEAKAARELFIEFNKDRAAYMKHGGIDIMAGHASAGIEINGQLSDEGGIGPDKKVVLIVPVGAGGPVGIAAGFKMERFDRAKTVIVQTEPYSAFIRSLILGRTVKNIPSPPPTALVNGRPVVFEDGIAVDMPEEEALKVAGEFVDRGVIVDDRMALDRSAPIAMADLSEARGSGEAVVGGTTAATVEALLENLEDLDVIKEADAIVLLGTEGNVDPDITEYIRGRSLAGPERPQQARPGTDFKGFAGMLILLSASLLAQYAVNAFSCYFGAPIPSGPAEAMLASMPFGIFAVFFLARPDDTDRGRSMAGPSLDNLDRFDKQSYAEVLDHNNTVVRIYDRGIPSDEVGGLDGVRVRVRLGDKGYLSFGVHTWASFSAEYGNRIADAYMEKGHVTKVMIYRADPADGVDVEEIFAEFRNADTGALLHAFWGNVRASLVDRLSENSSRLILKNYALSPNGALSFAGKTRARFGGDYGSRLIDAELEDGQVTKVLIRKENPSEGFETEKMLTQLRDGGTGRVVSTWWGHIKQKEYQSIVESRPGLILRDRLDSYGKLTLASRTWKTFGREFSGRYVEALIERGHVTSAAVYREDPAGGVELNYIFSQLIDRDTGMLAYAWGDAIHAETLRELAKSHPRLLLRHINLSGRGDLSFAKRVWARFGVDYAGREIEADIDEGHVTGVRIYRKNPEDGTERSERFIELRDPASNRLIYTWWENLSAEKFDKLIEAYPRLKLRNYRLPPSGVISFAHRDGGSLDPEYGGKLVEADLENGHVTKVKVYTISAEDGSEVTELEEDYSELRDRDTGKLLKTWRKAMTAGTLQGIARRYPRLAATHRISKAGMFEIGAITTYVSTRFKDYMAKAKLDDGKMRLVELIWQEDGGTVKSRVGPGFGRSGRRKLFEDEEDFVLDLAGRLEANGIDAEMSLAVSESLVRLHRDSLGILVQYEFMRQEDAEGIIGLDPERIDCKQLAQSIRHTVEGYRQLGIPDSAVNRLLATHIPPIGFINYLQRRYRLGRKMGLILQTLRRFNIEAWVKKYRDVMDRRGTLDRQKHLKEYRPENNDLLADTGRRDLLGQLKGYLQILRVLSNRGSRSFEYSECNPGRHGGYEMLIDAPRNDIRPGQRFYIGEREFLVEVVEVTGARSGKLIVEVREIGGAEATLPRAGTIANNPESVTYDVQIRILQRVIRNLEDTNCATASYPGTEEFAAIDRMLGLAKDVSPTNLDSIQVNFLDERIPRRLADGEWKGDESQEAAVKLALGGSRQIVVHGPAATGKTTAIVEMVRQYAKQGKRVLVVSQMNQAVDNVIKELMDDGSIPVARLGNNPSDFKYGTERVWFQDEEAYRGFRERFNRQRSNAFVFGATSIGIATDRKLRALAGTRSRPQFDVVIIDEASRETLTGALVPLQYLTGDGKLVVVGDRKQLPPFVLDEEIRALREAGIEDGLIDGFYRDVIGTLAGTGRADEVTLLTNWRSHPLLAGLVSELFYEGDVNRRGWEDFDKDTLSLKVIDISEERDYYETPVGDSYQNLRSARETLDLVEHYKNNRNVPLPKITIVTPYLAQVRLLEGMLQEKYRRLSTDSLPHVTTIDSYQGGENDTIIIDTVRSNQRGEIGFLKDLHRLCVILSRAQENLAIVWDSRVFMREPESVSEADRPAREIFIKLKEYYEREVLSFFPEPEGRGAIVSDDEDDDTPPSGSAAPGHIMLYAHDPFGITLAWTALRGLFRRLFRQNRVPGSPEPDRNDMEVRAMARKITVRLNDLHEIYKDIIDRIPDIASEFSDMVSEFNRLGKEYNDLGKPQEERQRTVKDVHDGLNKISGDLDKLKNELMRIDESRKSGAGLGPGSPKATTGAKVPVYEDVVLALSAGHKSTKLLHLEDMRNQLLEMRTDGSSAYWVFGIEECENAEEIRGRISGMLRWNIIRSALPGDKVFLSFEHSFRSSRSPEGLKDIMEAAFPEIDFKGGFISPVYKGTALTVAALREISGGTVAEPEGNLGPGAMNAGAPFDTMPLAGKLIVLDMDELMFTWHPEPLAERKRGEGRIRARLKGIEDKRERARIRGELSRSFMAEFRARHLRGEKIIKVRNELLPALKTLRENGAEIAVVTGSSHIYAEVCLEMAGALEYISTGDGGGKAIYCLTEDERKVTKAGMPVGKAFKDAARDFGKSDAGAWSRDTIFIGHDTETDIPWAMADSRGNGPVFIRLDELTPDDIPHTPLDTVIDIVRALSWKGDGDISAGFRSAYLNAPANGSRDTTSYRDIKDIEAGGYRFEMRKVYSDGLLVPVISGIIVRKAAPGTPRPEFGILRESGNFILFIAAGLDITQHASGQQVQMAGFGGISIVSALIVLIGGGALYLYKRKMNEEMKKDVRKFNHDVNSLMNTIMSAVEMDNGEDKGLINLYVRRKNTRDDLESRIRDARRKIFDREAAVKKVWKEIEKFVSILRMDLEKIPRHHTPPPNNATHRKPLGSPAECLSVLWRNRADLEDAPITRSGIQRLVLRPYFKRTTIAYELETLCAAGLLEIRPEDRGKRALTYHLSPLLLKIPDEEMMRIVNAMSIDGDSVLQHGSNRYNGFDPVRLEKFRDEIAKVTHLALEAKIISLYADSQHTPRYHAERVVRLSEMVARQRGDFTEDEIRDLRLAAYAHDIGKERSIFESSAIFPSFIRDKVTRQHPKRSLKLLQEAGIWLPVECLEAIRDHHKEGAKSKFTDVIYAADHLDGPIDTLRPHKKPNGKTLQEEIERSRAAMERLYSDGDISSGTFEAIKVLFDDPSFTGILEEALNARAVHHKRGPEDAGIDLSPYKAFGRHYADSIAVLRNSDAEKERKVVPLMMVKASGLDRTMRAALSAGIRGWLDPRYRGLVRWPGAVQNIAGQLESTVSPGIYLAVSGSLGVEGYVEVENGAIKMIEIAPWNRKEEDGKRRYIGVGPQMLAFVVAALFRKNGAAEIYDPNENTLRAIGEINITHTGDHRWLIDVTQFESILAAQREKIGHLIDRYGFEADDLRDPAISVMVAPPEVVAGLEKHRGGAVFDPRDARGSMEQAARTAVEASMKERARMALEARLNDIRVMMKAMQGERRRELRRRDTNGHDDRVRSVNRRIDNLRAEKGRIISRLIGEMGPETVEATKRRFGAVKDRPVKAVILDVDKNLTDSTRRITPEAIDIILWLRSEGVPVMLATGRHYRWVQGGRGPGCDLETVLLDIHRAIEIRGIPPGERRDILEGLYAASENGLTISNGFAEGEGSRRNYEEWLLNEVGIKLDAERERRFRGFLDGLNLEGYGLSAMGREAKERSYTFYGTAEEMAHLSEALPKILEDAGLSDENMNVLNAGEATDVVFYPVDKSICHLFFNMVLDIYDDKDGVIVAVGDSGQEGGNDNPMLVGRRGGLSSDKYDPADNRMIALALISGTGPGMPSAIWAMRQLLYKTSTGLKRLPHSTAPPAGPVPASSAPGPQPPAANPVIRVQAFYISDIANRLRHWIRDNMYEYGWYCSDHAVVLYQALSESRVVMDHGLKVYVRHWPKLSHYTVEVVAQDGTSYLVDTYPEGRGMVQHDATVVALRPGEDFVKNYGYVSESVVVYPEGFDENYEAAYEVAKVRLKERWGGEAARLYDESLERGEIDGRVGRKLLAEIGPETRPAGWEPLDIIGHIFRALDISGRELVWRELPDGFRAAEVPVEGLRRYAVLTAFNLPESEELKGGLSIISYRDMPVFLLFRSGADDKRRVVDLSVYYDLPGAEISGWIKRTAGCTFLAGGDIEYISHEHPFMYATFNQLGGLAGTDTEPRTMHLDRPRIVKIPVLPGVRGLLHPSSIISARATTKFVKPESRVLVLGTFIGLNARIAAEKGAKVDATDIKEMAVENTKLTCSRVETKYPVNAFVRDLFDGLGEYDFIIFDMPHHPLMWKDNGIPVDRITPSDRNLYDFNDELLNRFAEEVAGHLTEGGCAVIVNIESPVIRKLLEEKTGLSVATDFFGEEGDSMAYIIRKETPFQAQNPVLQAPGPKLQALLASSLRYERDKAGTPTDIVPEGRTVMLSEGLFDMEKKTELVELILKNKGSSIQILPVDELRRSAISGRATKDNTIIVLTEEEFNDPKVWNGYAKEERGINSSVLLLDDNAKFIGTNYLYLESVLKLSVAIMAGNRGAVGSFYKLIAGRPISDEALASLGIDPVTFALNAILEFDEMSVKDGEEFERYKRSMEIYLAAA
ncbi:MAG: pyridoxal-phosphate dependent enzyme [Candidatus Omnitrophota bacterium]